MRSYSGKLRGILVAVTALIILGSPAVVGVATASARGGVAPTIVSFTAAPTSLTSAGGSDSLSATVTHAASCVISSTPAISGLPSTQPCSSGSVSLLVNVPPNASAKAAAYTFTLAATGARTTKAKATVSQAGQPAPIISSFTALPTSVVATGGSTLLSATVTGATTCTFSSKPAIAALPSTQPCSAGSASLLASLPANTTTKSVAYTFTLAARGSSTTRAQTPVTVVADVAAVVTFNSEGGSAVGSKSGLVGTTITLPAAPTYPGHTFRGWFVAASGGTALTSPYTVTGPVTLYAQWNVNATAIISFNSEGGSPVGSMSGLVGTTITLPAAPTRAGNTFRGWFLVPSGGTALTSPYSLTGSVTLYAHWTAAPPPPPTDAYSYDAAGGSPTPPSGSGLDGTAIILGAAPTRAGYTFTGWNDGIATYSAGTTYYLASAGAPITFSAQWSANATDAYSYDAAGGSPTPPSGSGLDGTAITLGAAPTCAGYTFTGWNDGIATYSAGTTYYLASAGAPITFSAQWALAAPTLTDAEYFTNGIKLTFTAPPIAADQTITDYIYQISCDGGTSWSTVDALATTSPFTASGCYGAKYMIAAVINGTWYSPYSNPVTVDPLTAPTLTDAEYFTNGIKLTFTAPPIAADQTITDYIYQISCDGGTSWSTVDALATTSPFPASGCYGAKYMIAAVINGTWYSPYSNPVTVDPLTAPTLTDAEYFTNGIKLTFTAPPIAADQTITDYIYQISCDGGTSWSTVDALATTSPFTASGCYGAKYMIAAVINGTWYSPYSNPVTVDPLTAPTLTDAEYFTNGIKLTFTAPPIAADQTITDYIYQISCDGGTSWSTVDALATTSPFTASGCYGAQYMIAAVINGTWYSPYSNPVTVDPLTAPTLAGASYDGSSGGILTVSPPAIAADQTITDYIYQIPCDGGTSWSTVDALASTSPLY